MKLAYQRHERPRVHVADPKLVPREGEKLPHVYPGDELCLFHPKYREWNSSMLLAETILPWAAEWLLHYEIWMATGEWMGGGEHPKP